MGLKYTLCRGFLQCSGLEQRKRSKTQPKSIAEYVPKACHGGGKETPGLGAGQSPLGRVMEKSTFTRGSRYFCKNTWLGYV